MNGAPPVNIQSKSKHDALPNAVTIGCLPESNGNVHAQIQHNVTEAQNLLKHLEVPCEILDFKRLVGAGT